PPVDHVTIAINFSTDVSRNNQMVRFCKRQASIKAVESALENNVAVQAITDALGQERTNKSKCMYHGEFLVKSGYNVQLACRVLHNVLDQSNEFDFEDQVLNPGVHVPESDSQPTNDAPTQRATLAGRRHCGKITAQALAFNQ
ncbi:hypothetical protein MJO29_002611, partial [Puccinia striiformis f. sp. tritici]